MLHKDQWYELPEDEIAQAVFTRVQAIENNQTDIAASMQLAQELYANKPVLTIGGKYVSNYQDILRGHFSNTENVVASVCNTATAMVGRNRPKPTFQTDSAIWKIFRKARKMEKFVIGLYSKLKIYALGVRAFRDATIDGFGCIKIWGEDNEIKAERVNPAYIVVDNLAASDSPPREMHYRRFVGKDVLASQYPEFESEIQHAQSAYGPYSVSVGNLQADMVPVIESWRLPYKNKDGDLEGGRHSICIANKALFEETYEDTYFPFCFFNWEDAISGWYPTSLVESIEALQRQLNDLNRFIRRCQKLIAVPRVFGDFGNKIPKNYMDDEIGKVINTRGGKPVQFYTPQALTAELYNERDRIVRRMHELAGISEATSHSTKPQDLESAPALREWNDIEGARLAIPAQAFEEFHMKIAEHIILEAKKLYSKNKETGERESDLKVSYPQWRNRQKLIKTINWSEVDPEEDTFKIDIEAASIMSRTPAGRKADAIDLFQSGLIGLDQARRLTGHPDVERELDQDDAPMDDIEAVVESLEEGIWEAPEPTQDLQLGIKKVNQAYLNTRRYQDVPDDVPEMMLRWLDQANSILNPPDQGTPPGAAMAAQDPNAPGQPPVGQGPPGPAQVQQPPTYNQMAA